MRMKKVYAILMISVILGTLLSTGVPSVMSAAIEPTAKSIATVGNVPPYVCCKWEEPDDDPVKDGTQVMPNPYPEMKEVVVKACVCDGNGNEDITHVFAVVTDSEGNVIAELELKPDENVSCDDCKCIYPGIDCTGYSGVFEMGPCAPAGNYTVNVTAVDSQNETASMENVFEYLSLKALAINFDTVAFEGNPGDENVTGEELFNNTVVNSTITSVGNDPVDVGIEATDLTDGAGNVIGGENMSAIIAGEESVIKPEHVWDVGLGCNEDTSVTFLLDIPAGTNPGMYEGKIIITPH